MKKINLLFLAPNWRVSLIHTFQNALNSFAPGNDIAGADSNIYSPALKTLDTKLNIPRFDHPDCLKSLLTFCREKSINAIIPLTNRAIEYLDKNRKPFTDLSIRLYINNSEIISICHDKEKLSNFFQEKGIPTPSPFDLLSPSFPLISKPKKGEGGKNCFVINDQVDLDYCQAKFPNQILQQFIEGDEYTIDWFSDSSGLPLVVIPRKRIETRAGEVTLSQIDLNQGIIEQAKKMAAVLGLKGPCNLQGFKESSGRFLFTDINLRFGSGSVHSISQGADIPNLIFKELAGEKLEFNLTSIKDGSVMSRYNDGFFF
jgi:carbamoyl-phosphate synthase large subunit